MDSAAENISKVDLTVDHACAVDCSCGWEKRFSDSPGCRVKLNNRVGSDGRNQAVGPGDARQTAADIGGYVQGINDHVCHWVELEDLIGAKLAT